MPGCTAIKLTTNYRSHRAIVERYDRWMASADWSNRGGAPFRYDKTIAANDAALASDIMSRHTERTRQQYLEQRLAKS